MGKIICVGGVEASTSYGIINDSFMEVYDCRAEVWTPMLPSYHTSASLVVSAKRRLQFGAALLGHRLFVVGGREGLKSLDTLDCLDLSSNVWFSLPPMQTQRHALQATCVDEQPVLYALGGFDGWSFLSCVERLNNKKYQTCLSVVLSES